MSDNEMLSSDEKMFIIEENERRASLKDVWECFKVSPSAVWQCKWKKSRQEGSQCGIKIRRKAQLTSGTNFLERFAHNQYGYSNSNGRKQQYLLIYGPANFGARSPMTIIPNTEEQHKIDFLNI